mgnify:CR=1 FL=1
MIKLEEIYKYINNDHDIKISVRKNELGFYFSCGIQINSNYSIQESMTDLSLIGLEKLTNSISNHLRYTIIKHMEDLILKYDPNFLNHFKYKSYATGYNDGCDLKLPKSINEL